MIVFEYCKTSPGGGEESFSSWLRGLDAGYRGSIIQRLITMQQSSRNDFDAFVDGANEGGVKYKGIYKMKFGGRIEYRPLLCRGIGGRERVTMLVGAEKHDGRTQPSPQVAVDRKKEIEANPNLQRLLRIQNPKTNQWLNQPVN